MHDTLLNHPLLVCASHRNGTFWPLQDNMATAIVQAVATRLPNLANLKLNDMVISSSGTISALAQCSSLRSLDLVDGICTEDALSGLSRLTQLTSLVVKPLQTQDTLLLANLAPLTRLQVLEVSCRVTGCKHLRELTQLTKLVMSLCVTSPFTWSVEQPQLWSAVSALKQLSHLEVPGAAVDPKAMSSLQQLPLLEYLSADINPALLDWQDHQDHHPHQRYMQRLPQQHQPAEYMESGAHQRKRVAGDDGSQQPHKKLAQSHSNHGSPFSQPNIQMQTQSTPQAQPQPQLPSLRTLKISGSSLNSSIPLHGLYHMLQAAPQMQDLELHGRLAFSNIVMYEAHGDIAFESVSPAVLRAVLQRMAGLPRLALLNRQSSSNLNNLYPMWLHCNTSGSEHSSTTAAAEDSGMLNLECNVVDPHGDMTEAEMSELHVQLMQALAPLCSLSKPRLQLANVPWTAEVAEAVVAAVPNLHSLHVTRTSVFEAAALQVLAQLHHLQDLGMPQLPPKGCPCMVMV